MAMFDDYPSPDGYVPDNTTEVLPEPPKEPETLPRILYNVEGDFIGYAWEHGDTLTIHHEIDEYIRQRAVGATVKVVILDHNRLEIDSFNVVGNDIINIDIGQELSNKMIDGNYYIDLTVIGDDFTYGCKEISIIVGGRRMSKSAKPIKPQTLITTNQIANGAVTTAKIADGAITTEKLSPDIDIGGSAYDYIIDMTATIPSDGSESSDVVMAQDIQEVCAMLDDHNKTCAVRLHYSVSGDDGWTPCSIIIPMVDAHTEVFDWTVYISRFEIGSGIRDVCIEVAIWYERDEETGKYSLWDDMPQVRFTYDDSTIDTDRIASGAITSIKIADSAVTTDKIADGAITAEKLSSDITIGGDKFSDLRYHHITLTVPFDEAQGTTYTFSFGWVNNDKSAYKNLGELGTALASRMYLNENSSLIFYHMANCKYHNQYVDADLIPIYTGIFSQGAGNTQILQTNLNITTYEAQATGTIPNRSITFVRDTISFFNRTY